MFVNKLFKSIKNPKKALKFIKFMLEHNFRKKRGTLLIIGLESDGIFSLIYKGYERCYCFEANPERFKKLEKKYSKYSHIKLYNVAVAQYNGEITFNISNNNNGASSSIGKFKEEWTEKYLDEPIKMIKSITVPCINLYDFCVNNNVSYIDDYISDIQGMDLEVLKTMKPMLDKKQIGTIMSEVTKDGKENIYADLPSNALSDFNLLLSPNYKLVSQGWGVLKDGEFEKIPEDAWEMDCKWKVQVN
ncbi:MAG: FkbM family methyltransferase [Sphingobacteriaceae bacterium]|nr:FkbM family methyltransferase [Sphingobacteriaceae bacterium]